MRHLEFDYVPLFPPLTPCHSQAVVSGLDVQILLTAEQEATRSVTKQTIFRYDSVQSQAICELYDICGTNLKSVFTLQDIVYAILCMRYCGATLGMRYLDAISGMGP